MESEELKQKSRALINNLLELPFAQTFSIIPIEQKLQLLSEQNVTVIDPLIGLIFANLALGKRQKALGLCEQIWDIGGDLSPFLELVYADCLLNLGEIEKAEILLAEKFDNLGDNLNQFYMVLVKYALLSGKLNLLQQIAEYPNIYEQESELFKFADNHAANFSLRDYRIILKMIFNGLADKLCAVEYMMYPDEGIEIIFYTSVEKEPLALLQDEILNRIDTYFQDKKQPDIDDLFFQFVSIKNHPAWFASED